MIFLIFDTAINDQYSLIQLQKQYENNKSLFHGTKDEALSDISPYIFEIDASLFDKMDKPLINLNQLVYFETDETIDKVVDHFQQFIYKLIYNKEYFFRFWDARVLTRYLQECNADQLSLFFGNVRSFFVEDPTKKSFQKYEMGRKNNLLQVELQKKIFLDVIPTSAHKQPTDDVEQPKKRRFFVD
jgi:hypothetical protein